MITPEVETGPGTALLYIAFVVAAIIGIYYASTLLSLAFYLIPITLALIAIYYVSVRIDNKLGGRKRR